MIIGFISPQTLLFILVLLFFFFGGRLIPRLTGALRRSASEFRKGRRENKPHGDEKGPS